MSELLKVSASTSITNKLGLTPLAEAIVSGQLANARLLLTKVPSIPLLFALIASHPWALLHHVLLFAHACATLLVCAMQELPVWHSKAYQKIQGSRFPLAV